MIAYDSTHKRLALFQREATPDFWDEQWDKEELLKNITSGNTYHFLKKTTTTYVPVGGRILEGGCGTGQVVYAMDTWGYKAQGVDYAAKTVQTVNELVPDLQITLGDVRNLDFPDSTFDAYWSLGVIEHFWNGFEPITKEAARVLKPGGYLFLTFPWMSPLRRIKARLGMYPDIKSVQNVDAFYEFMLDTPSIVRQLESQGFTCVESFPHDALKGLKDEVTLLRPILQPLYKSRSMFARAIRYALTLILARITGHMMLLVCKKSSSVSP